MREVRIGRHGHQRRGAAARCEWRGGTHQGPFGRKDLLLTERTGGRSRSDCGCRTNWRAARRGCAISRPGSRRPGSTGCSSATTSRSGAATASTGWSTRPRWPSPPGGSTVQTAVYLLPLRHPVPVARQVASLAALAPGRLVFGVGLGGEDPAELRACGIEPTTRGRRMDEALAVLRPLLAGAEVTMAGDLLPPGPGAHLTGPGAAGADRDRRAVRRGSAPGGQARRRLARPVGVPRAATRTPSR